MRKFIENQPGVCIFIGAVLGFILPGLSYFPSKSVLGILASVIFLACFNITGLDYKSISLRSFIQYYVLRYLALPYLMFQIVTRYSPELAISFTLYFLLPAGVSSPALSNIYGGNVTLGLMLCLFTHLMTPILIPFMCRETIGTLLAIDTKAMFFTLFITIISPVVLYFITRNIKTVNSFCTRYNRVASILLVSSIGTFVIGIQREMFLSNLQNIPLLFAYTALGMLFLFVYAWMTEYKEHLRNRITYTVVSGFNNTALGFGVALLYFPPYVALFLIVSEIPWCVAPLLFSPFIKKKQRASAPGIS
jgi:predicted Na+-dependent transporter